MIRHGSQSPNAKALAPNATALAALLDETLTRTGWVNRKNK